MRYFGGCWGESVIPIYSGYVIGMISEVTNDAGEFDWVIQINWENWEIRKTAGVRNRYGFEAG